MITIQFLSTDIEKEICPQVSCCHSYWWYRLGSGFIQLEAICRTIVHQTTMQVFYREIKLGLNVERRKSCLACLSLGLGLKNTVQYVPRLLRWKCQAAPKLTSWPTSRYMQVLLLVPEVSLVSLLELHRPLADYFVNAKQWLVPFASTLNNVEKSVSVLMRKPCGLERRG